MRDENPMDLDKQQQLNQHHFQQQPFNANQNQQQFNQQPYNPQPAPKKGMSGWAIGLIIAGVIFLMTSFTFIGLGFFTTAVDSMCTEDPMMEGCEEYQEDYIYDTY